MTTCAAHSFYGVLLDFDDHQMPSIMTMVLASILPTPNADHSICCGMRGKGVDSLHSARESQIHKPKFDMSAFLRNAKKYTSGFQFVSLLQLSIPNKHERAASCSALLSSHKVRPYFLGLWLPGSRTPFPR